MQMSASTAESPQSASQLDLRDRAALFTRLQSETFDLLVIGGGITGAGIVRDAAMRGLRVALVEAQDFASGTSSRSSKMIHGGLRYLIKGDIAVVRESVSERETLHHIAPHLARKMPYIVGTRHRLEQFIMRVALTVYERLGRVAASDRHQRWSREQLRANEPTLAADNYYAAVVYPEYLTDDARLTLANIRSAYAHGAQVANYCKVVGVAHDEHFTVNCQAQLPGENHTFSISARAVVNAAGPWVDAVAQLENPAQPKRLALSRGIHLVVEHVKLPVLHTVVMASADGRRVFAVPVGDFTYLGTTDDFYPDTEYWPPVTTADICYLLGITASYFPANPLLPADIVSAWSGIRPLVAEGEGVAAKELSRKDEVWHGTLGMWSVGGGKLSAYRAMAERLVDKLVAAEHFNASPCTTHQERLPGGGALTAPLTAVPEHLLQRLQSLYGSEAEIVLSLGGDLEAEVTFAVHCEGALRLEDYWARRSSRAWFELAGGVASLRPAAAIMARLLDWDEARQAIEIAHCEAIDAHSRQEFS